MFIDPPQDSLYVRRGGGLKLALWVCAAPLAILDIFDR